ncbi:proline reductase-associated electron transfer protein PrdC [Tissierella praeacuta DSM 18095]|uniref:Proline reductase-associated electron transfer protein PrdC n=1 Tax=Tissierella praeacuta DSM 18095 TaxID=1123404 RepID=A0A1M4TJJ6_9FIRM|nr:proline reductase-associated electron transfer protein PrdC [Tissierella praeacuta]SHE44457.1 proline reductase-associated electron transfer protein PrdC [Tissierella praeacuta DSM 18095]SUP04586.1 Nitrogen fixation protein rnfC [Tissierella praeacuta]
MALYRIPLKQHVGAPCVEVIKIGDKVLRGQCIAEPNGLGAKIHSSVTGKVINITDEFMEIEGEIINKEDYVKIKKCKSISETAYEAGIVGAGGAGFPAYIKLKSEIPDGVVIANCVECEPILNHNIKLLEENPEIVIKGLRYAMEATKAPKGYIAIKAKNQAAISSLRKVIGNAKDIEVKELKDIYPMGEERAIIHEIFGTWLTPEQLPIEAKSVVMNGETLANLTRAVEDLKPVIDKDITVGGKLKSGKEANVFFQVPIGTPISILIDKCGGIDGDYGEVVIGGPYTGKAGDIHNSVVTKISGGAIVTIPLPEYKGPIGLLVCACGADEVRLRDIAEKMKSEVVAVTKCKNAVEVRGVNKCLTPGDCPGQVQGVMHLKKNGAKRILISNCSDCTNTVMCCAPNMGVPVYHHTDHIFRTVGHELTRRLPMEEKK